MVSAASPSDVFHAIADPSRRRMLDLLRDGELAVKTIAAPFRMSQPAVSQHLRVLREAGLVVQRKAGRQRLYRLAPEAVRDVHAWAAHFERFWTERLDALGDYLDRTASQDDDPVHDDE